VISGVTSRVHQARLPARLPVWQVEVLDFDPQAREKTFKVKIAAAVQPVPPAAVEGAPVRPVVLENLTVTPWIKGEDGPRPKIAYSLRCTGLAAPGRAALTPRRRLGDHRVQLCGPAGGQVRPKLRPPASAPADSRWLGRRFALVGAEAAGFEPARGLSPQPA
jgi:hypothetical protein